MHAQPAIDQTINRGEDFASILERLYREPGLPGWVLMAPTRTLAALGISLDDEQLVDLLEQIEALDNRITPVTARELMTSNVITIPAESSTHEAARLLADHRISGLPVLASDGSIAGLLSVYDLLAKPGARVSDIMSREVTTVRDTASLSSVRAVLVSQHLRRVPVVDSLIRLVGIISLGDLVRELAYR
jgi:CBS-domain-containing membrane protein